MDKQHPTPAVEILARRPGEDWIIYAYAPTLHFTVTDPIVAWAFDEGYVETRIRTAARA